MSWFTSSGCFLGSWFYGSWPRRSPVHHHPGYGQHGSGQQRCKNAAWCVMYLQKGKGLSPLSYILERVHFDTVFRGAKKHSNDGNTAKKSIRHLVKAIRKKYDPDVPIIIASDAGFYDKKRFGISKSLKYSMFALARCKRTLRNGSNPSARKHFSLVFGSHVHRTVRADGG